MRHRTFLVLVLLPLVMIWSITLVINCGGCWVAEHNAAEGDVLMIELINQTGSIWHAFYSYNGSGAAAVNYANNAVAIVSEWRARLA